MGNIRRVALSAIVLTALLVPAVPPAPAHHDGHAVLLSGSGHGGGWITFHLAVPAGESASMGVSACNWIWAHQTEIISITPEGTWSKFGASGENRGGTLVHVDAGVLTHTDDDLTKEAAAGQHCSGPGGLAVTGPADRTIVMYAAGDLEFWTYFLSATAGVQVTKVAQGTETFFYASKDFRGLANVQAWPSVGAHAAAATEIAVTVKGRLFGQFTSGFHSVPTGADAMTVTLPDGTTHACACRFHGEPDFAPELVTGQPGWTAGDYVFRLTGAGVGGDFEDVRLVGADVRFP